MTTFTNLKRTGGGAKWEKPGTTLTGTVAGIDLDQDDNGNDLPVLVIDTPDGEVRVTCYQMDLRDKVLAWVEVHGDPQPGDRIRITYTADKALKGGRTLKQFDVRIARPTPAPVQDELVDDGDLI